MATSSNRESHTRSVLKGFTWRLIATSTTFTISFLLIKFGVEDPETSAKALQTAGWIAGLEFFIKIFLYYVHERLWQMAPRGSIRRLLGFAKKANGPGDKDEASDS